MQGTQNILPKVQQNSFTEHKQSENISNEVSENLRALSSDIFGLSVTLTNQTMLNIHH